MSLRSDDVDLRVAFLQEAVELSDGGSVLGGFYAIEVAVAVVGDLVEFLAASAISAPLSETPVAVANAEAHSSPSPNDLGEGWLLPSCVGIFEDGAKRMAGERVRGS